MLAVLLLAELLHSSLFISFPLFFFRFLEMFSALAGRDLAPNTVVTIKNNI